MLMKLLSVFVLFFLMISFISTNEETDVLKKEIEQIVSDKDAVVGVSIIAKNGKDIISLNGDKPFPMQSVFKFHIAVAVLAEVDKGKFSLDHKIEVHKEELLPGLWSPLREEHPNGGSFSIATLIKYAVSQSDNVATDILIRLIGAPKTVEEFFKENNIEDIAIIFNEENMQSNWEHQFQNWTTPNAASEALKKFYDQDSNLLSNNSHELIWQAMKETTTGKNRLKGQLPEGTVVAHKTGWSGTHKETGITAAVNNIGIAFMPNDEHFFISVFVTESTESFETNEKIISDIAKATYDFYARTTE